MRPRIEYRHIYLESSSRNLMRSRFCEVMIFHAWPSDSAGGRGDRGAERQVLMERVTWSDGWPVVGSGVPCRRPQRRPLCESRAWRPEPLAAGRYRFRVGQGWDVYMGYAGLTKGEEVFEVLEGLEPGGTISLKAGDRFLRHSKGQLEPPGIRRACDRHGFEVESEDSKLILLDFTCKSIDV